MKSFTSLVGWMLLVALVAVPSVLFYNWLSNNKGREAETAAAAPSKAPSPAALFAGADKAALPPVTAAAQPKPAAWPQAAAAASAAAPKAAEPPAQAPRPVQAAQQPVPEMPPSASAPPPRMQPDPADKQAQAALAASTTSAQVAVSTQAKKVSYFDPKSQRDPTMSPDDYQKIKDEEDRRREEERLARLAELRKKQVDSPASRIDLQGIVGNQAIINGEMYTVGQTVKGARIVRIGSDYIICEWKDKGELKRFTKKMQ